MHVWPELAGKQSLVERREEVKSSCRLRGGDCATVGRLRSDPPPSSLSGQERAALLPAVTLRIIKGWASLPPPLHPHWEMSF